MSWSIPHSIGTLKGHFDVFVDDLGSDMLEFSPQQGSTSLRLRVVFQPVIEGLTGPLLTCWIPGSGGSSVAPFALPCKPGKK